jgi:alpha-ketoglutarate-dependent dioxygenase FTO
MLRSTHKKEKRKKSEEESSSSNKKRKPAEKGSPPSRKKREISSSHLKRVRGTAESTPLPPEWSQQSNFISSSKSFLSPEDGDTFISCLKECYRGFYSEAPDQLPSSFHTTFDKAFDSLYDAGLFLYDAVQPGGKRLSKTFVTRTLLGKPGSTYRYLGLRLFSHPWTAVTEDGDMGGDRRSLVSLGYSNDCSRGLLAIGDLNASLIDRTKRILETETAPHVPEGLVGSADFSLTLINRMEPTTVKKDLKREKLYGMGKTSVSWHKDSGLADFSSIAVYHCLRDKTGDTPWRVALRVANAPPLAIPLPSGSLYYLLDEFNHQHEHAVLAGSNQLRYSSTHRVAREGRGTWQYIRDKCRGMLGAPPSESRLVKETRAEQQLLDEIEFEWLRQWYIQGKHHARLHPYWHKPIEQLEGWFGELEKRCMRLIEKLRESCTSRGKILFAPSVTEDVFDVLIESLEGRSKTRLSWKERVQDPLFESMPENSRPFSSPVLDRAENLAPLVAELRKYRKLFVKRKGHVDHKTASLTKKETRKIASNWESMKATFSKKAN